MAALTKFKNKRRWQEVGAATLLTCIIALPTMVFAAYAPDVLREWQSVRQQYGPGIAYALVGVFALLTTLFTIPAIVFAWQNRGSMDWILGKRVDSDPDDNQS